MQTKPEEERALHQRGRSQPAPRNKACEGYAKQIGGAKTVEPNRAENVRRANL